MALDYIADMNISPETVKLLARQGWSISRVSDFLPATSPDSLILEFARGRRAVLVTQDLDFSMLLAVGGHAGPSVLSFRLSDPSPKYVAQRFAEIVPGLTSELSIGVVVSVGTTSMRYRFLPIGR